MFISKWLESDADSVFGLGLRLMFFLQPFENLGCAL
jgi:hypothetical protein